MTQKNQSAITPTRVENFPEWYQKVIKVSDLAENSPVRGCMVIKPWGYAIWERMQFILDQMFKKTGHVNAYFPLLIPLSFLKKEAEHVEGFAKECAVVTHHRLQMTPDGDLVPDGKLEEPMIIRPTSETIIGHSYSKWVQSYRDLPILINQWANVMRWEMRPRLFLRTSEFLWQEGHTVHATQEEAIEETLKMLAVYKEFCEQTLGIPVVTGMKTKDEKFPGAVDTYTIEALMQDGKAIQGGTSHFLGQNFAKASEIKFLNKDGQEEYGWTTSWGVTTRLIGGLIMTHGDDDGLKLPPKIAPQQVVILPVIRKASEQAEVFAYCDKLAREIEEQSFNREACRVFVDKRDISGGEKGWDHIKKGVPIRLEVGPRDIAQDSVFMGRRDQDPRNKKSLSRTEFLANLPEILKEIQTNYLEKALAYRQERTVKIDSLADFYDFFREDNQNSGFALVHWNEKAIGHAALKELKVTPRCIPLPENSCYDNEPGTCIFSQEKSSQRILFAKAY